MFHRHVLAAAAALVSAVFAAHWSGQEHSAFAQTPQVNHAEVRKVLDKFRAARPDDKELTIFQLDWAPTLQEAKEKGAREKRPIALIVVTNSYGNLYTGHC